MQEMVGGKGMGQPKHSRYKHIEFLHYTGETAAVHGCSSSFMTFYALRQPVFVTVRRRAFLFSEGDGDDLGAAVPTEIVPWGAVQEK